MLAVPGEITSPLSAGTNALLRLGATPVTCAQDVLELFGLTPAERQAPPVEGDATRILAALPATADELARATGLAAGAVAGALTALELAGLVHEAEGLYRAPPSTPGRQSVDRGFA